MPTSTERGLPLELLLEILHCAIRSFLAKPQLVVLDVQHDPRVPDEGLRLRCMNGRFLNANNTIGALRRTSPRCFRETEHLLQTLPDGAADARELMQFPVRGLHLRTDHDVFLLVGVLPAIVHATAHWPGIQGVDVDDFKVLKRTMVLAAEFLHCFTGGVLAESPRDATRRLLDFFGDRGGDPGVLFVLLGDYEDVPPGFVWEHVQLLPEEQRRGSGVISERELEQIRDIRYRWLGLTSRGRQGMPRLQTARIPPAIRAVLDYGGHGGCIRSYFKQRQQDESNSPHI